MGQWQLHMEAGRDAFERGRLPEAETQLLQALEALKLQRDDARLAATLSNLAAVYHSLGKYAFAEDHYKRSIAIKERLYGEEHRDIAVDIHNLAVLYSARRNYHLAETMYLKALTMREKLLGPEHHDLLPVLYNYAELLRRQKRIDEAEKIVERAKALERK